MLEVKPDQPEYAIRGFVLALIPSAALWAATLGLLARILQ